MLNWSAELADLGIPDSLDHSDLHEGQLFNPEPGRFTFFDEQFTERYGPDSLPRLRDAYLEPWTGNGRSSKELRRALTLAGRLGVISRAVTWGRIFPGASDETRATGAAESTKRLLQLATTEPLF